jgi:hypothetical protein
VIIWCGSADPAQRVDFSASLHDIRIICERVTSSGINPTNVHLLLCSPDLAPERWDGPIRSATADELRALLSEISGSTDDRLLLIATNHGDYDGLLVSSPPPDPFDYHDPPSNLGPQVLSSCLDIFAGEQVLILGTCYSGIFCNRPAKVVLT